ncbi:hypothetical protein NMS_2336 [Nonlabens marinus S1-08]|uniref:Uncharacterized protein n=1 Tax=Nonlabens marinus S1-08 TaxID=1454201 RepID=W8VSM9_9FLAO|nr:hypothetical protein NMS_2336 [Nonlabens marinus S1-08]
MSQSLRKTNFSYSYKWKGLFAFAKANSYQVSLHFPDLG